LRVGFLLFHPLSESLGSARRVIDIAIELKKEGIEPVIITPFSKRTTIRGIDIVEMPGFSGFGRGEQFYQIARNVAGNSLLGKFVIRNMVRRKISNAQLAFLKELNLDVLQMEQELTAVMALPLVKTLGIPLVLEFHGIWIDELIDSGLISAKGKECRILRESISEAIKQIDAILVLSEEMKNYITEKYEATNEQVYTVGMGIRPKIECLPERNNSVKVVYAGMLSKEKNVDLLLKSIPYILAKNKEISFYLTKKGDMVNAASKAFEQCGGKVEFFWFNDENQLFDFLSQCNIGILTLPDNLSYQINPASKFFDYLSVGLPIVMNNIGGWTKAIEEDDVGLLSTNDPEDFAAAILRLAENQELALKFGKKCLELSKSKYNLDTTVAKLLKLYSSLHDEDRLKMLPQKGLPIKVLLINNQNVKKGTV
jgi:glycosyltransferase involved in cell wall biosynthesis